MQVSEVMSRSVELIDPDTLIRDAARKMRERDVGALPVGEDDRLVGMVTDRDIAMRAVAESRSADATAVREVMSGGVAYCYEEDPVEEAARIMAQHKLRRLPVINRDKRLVGIVALGDLARSGSESARATLQALESVSEPTGEPRRYKDIAKPA